jgi:aspartyl-tRNA synthetase
MLRNATCGELNISDIGNTVTLAGWCQKLRNLGSLVFMDIRDRYGITQVNISPELYETVKIKSEYCIQVTGKVVRRSEANSNLATGEIEILAEEIKIFSKSKLPPFIIADETDALEDTRLKNRYLDLRRPTMLNNLVIRSKLLKASRDYLESLKFLEVETPTLIKSTPEGARDYLVPSRTKPGKFFALPQSPQIFKQLLMIGGIDRYYQIARCYRDEDLRADRQPEFTQIDCEMSFVTREDVLQVIEGLVTYMFDKVIDYKLPKFKRISFKDAISQYGSDKPDMRFDMLIQDVTDILSVGEFKAFEGKKIKAIVVPNYADKCSRKIQAEDIELAKKFKTHGVSFFKMTGNQIAGSLDKFYTPEQLNKLIEKLSLKENDLVIVGADEKEDNMNVALGAIRLKYGRELGFMNPDVFAPCFVIDWPIFGEEDGQVVSLSNPFTRPRDEDLKFIDTDPTRILSYAYDTVINGSELSSGSLRIFDGELQQKIFELLGLGKEEIKNRFGFFVEAFDYGTPPHGGFALGVERLAMLLAKTENVRDVVAFPKNLSAVDTMCEAPSSVPQENLDILGIQLKEKK